MGLIKLIKTGAFSALLDFSVPGRSIALWAAFLIGILGQLVLERRAKKRENRIWFCAAAVILILICEFTQYGRILPEDPSVVFIYACLVCMLAGIAIPAAAVWILNKKKKSSAPQEGRSADGPANRAGND